LKSAGMRVARVEVDGGKLSFIPSDEIAEVAPADELGQWLAKKEKTN